MSLRDIERESIRSFVAQAASEGYLSGRVLDYGCGKQPYREIIEGVGSHYIPYDDPRHPGVVDTYVGDWSETDPINAILCTQVTQFVPDVPDLLSRFFQMLSDSGCLVMSYVTNWAEVEPGDLHRHTRAGMERLLTNAEFRIIQHAPREIVAVTLDGENLYAGYGVVARA